MKITFIHPNFYARPSADAMQPLVFSILAGLTPPDVEVTFFDDRIEEIDFDDKTDLIALTVQTFTAARAYRIAAKYRERGIPVVMGGFHPTLLPEEALLHADAVVIGDAEKTWPQVVEDARKNKLKRIYKGSFDYSLTGLKPAPGIFKGKKYKRMVPVQFGRGCRFACDFCSVRSFYGNSIRQKPVKEVAAEIEALDKKFIFFVDDNLFGNYERTIELLHALIPLKIKWACQISVDAAYNTALMKLIKKSGCKSVYIGFESLDPENLKQMKKAGNLKHGDYIEAVGRFKENGIMVCGSFLFGYDYDTTDSIERALDFAMNSRLVLAHFNPLFVIPGTPLYQRLKAEKRLMHRAWWLSPEYNYGEAQFFPRGMTPEELTGKCFEARCRFNSYGSIAKRGVDLKANCRSPFHLSAFIAANLISRKEIYRKQGTKLG